MTTLQPPGTSPEPGRPGDGPVLPGLIGVYGGGRMGVGIAHAVLATGSRAVVIEADAEAAAAARERIGASLGKAAERGALADSPAVLLDRLEVTHRPGALTEAGLVIEAVPERLELKSDVLRLVEREAPEAFLATNTSSLPVSSLAAALVRPEHFIGLHFFNPVPASDLIEVVVGEKTPPELVERARGWAEALGKTPIVVRDFPGFASSRLGVALALEAIRMVEEQVAEAQDIDTAMTLGYRHHTGPLKTTDIVGLDVRLAIAEQLERELGPRFAPPRLLREKVAAGQLGRKTGQGFYTW